MATENIPSRLHCVAEGNITTGANELWDDDLEKRQSEINREQLEHNQESDNMVEVLENTTVRFTPQSLTEGEQEQARQNISTYSKNQTNNIVSRTPLTDIIIVKVEEGQTIEQALNAATGAPVIMTPTGSIDGKLINTSGEEFSVSGGRIDIYPVTAGNQYFFSGKYSSSYFGLYFLNWFDSNGTFISGSYLKDTEVVVTYNQEPVIAPAGAAYCYLNVQKEFPSDFAFYNSATTAKSNNLFRVPGPTNTTYSEWAWDGTQWVMLDEKDYGIDDFPIRNSDNVVKSGGLYDTYNAVTKENLTLLTPVVLDETFIMPGGEERVPPLPSTQVFKYEVLGGKEYAFSGEFSSGFTGHFVNWFDANGDFISQSHYSADGTEDIYKNEIIVAPLNAFYLYLNVQKSQSSMFNASSVVREYISSEKLYNDVELLKQGLWLYENHLINHSGQGDYDIMAHNDYDIIAAIIPSGAYNVEITGVTCFFQSVDLFSSTIPSEWITENHVDDIQDAKVAVWTLRKSDNPNGYLSAIVNWSLSKSDAIPVDGSNNYVLSRGLFNILKKDVHSEVTDRTQHLGYINSNNGTIVILSTYTHYLYDEVIENDEYTLYAGDFTQGSELQIAFFIKGITENGYILYGEIPNTRMTVSYQKIVSTFTVPEGVIGIVVVSRSDGDANSQPLLYHNGGVIVSNQTICSETDANSKAISDYIVNDIETPSPREGYYIGNNGMEESLASMNEYIYTGINPSVKYKAKGFSVPSAGYTGLYFVHYFHDSRWLGYDENCYVAQGPFAQGDYVELTVPFACNKILIQTERSTTPSLANVIIGNKIESKKLSERISNIELYDIKNINAAISRYTKTLKEGTVTYGQFILVTGVPKQIAVMNMYTYEGIDPSKSYVVSGFGIPSAGYDHIAFIHYYNGNTWLGYDSNFYAEIGPYFCDTDSLLTIPENCNKIVINQQREYDAPSLSELTLGEKIISQELLNNSGSSSEGNKMMKIVKGSNRILMRTSLNDAEDIIVSYTLNGNNGFTWDCTYLGSKDASDDEILENCIQVMGDSTGPLGITNPAPWHLWAQHGYCIPYITATHTLTSDDIGSVWKDQRDREYTIGNISGNNIYLLPTVRATEYSGVYTRDWRSPTGVNNPQITSLTHVSGATHTDGITATSYSDTQLRPMMVLADRKFIADGNEITENGTYHCNEFVISQTMNCTDPWTVESWYPVIQKEVGAILTETFTMCGLSCRYDTILNMQKPYIFTWYGANQIQHFVPIATMPDCDVYGMMPRSKSYSSPHLANNLSRSAEWVYRATNLTGDKANNNLIDINKQADRFITFFKNNQTDEMKIGCAGGLSLTRGLTKDSARNQICRVYQDGDLEILSISPANRNKGYFKVLTASNFENSILPASYIGQFSTYISYFDPMANEGQVYWYKDGNGYVIYAHYQTAQTKTAIKLPVCMEGLSVEVVDKTDGMALFTDIISDGIIYISATAFGDNNLDNYIVLTAK